jgi:hypothetical protein
LWLKLAATRFFAVMIPIYRVNYGLTNFLLLGKTCGPIA